MLGIDATNISSRMAKLQFVGKDSVTILGYAGQPRLHIEGK